MPSEEFYVHLKTASGNYKCSEYPEPSATVAFKLIISKVFIHKNGEKVAYQTTYACTWWNQLNYQERKIEMNIRQFTSLKRRKESF